MERPDHGSLTECVALLEPLRFQLTSIAVARGACPGSVFVDDGSRPAAVFVAGPEAHYLAGDPDATFVGAVNDWLHREAGEEWYCVAGDAWRPVLEGLLAPRSPIPLRRRHYTLTAAATRETPVPAGYTLRPLDAELLRDPPPAVRKWVEESWRTAERFLADGFGTVAIGTDDGGVSAWSIADCVVDGAAEIGIETAPAHRRRGLGAACAAACARQAFDRGLTQVGWHTNTFNVGSCRTAERIGFVPEREYFMHYAVRDAAEHARHVAAWRAAGADGADA